MKKPVLLLLLAGALACNRERTHTTQAPTASADATGTWVAQPSELSPEQIRTVQRALGDRGFAVEPSGSFDDQTKVALSDFQRSRGLPSTGNLNADTAAALGIDPKDVMPVRGTTDTGAADAGKMPQQPNPADDKSRDATTMPGQHDAPVAPDDQGSPRTTEPKY